MKEVMRVHNIMEAKALIKESYAQGAEHEFEGTEWYTHDGKYIAKSFVRDVEFELVVEDTDTLDGYKSITMEVL